MTNPIPVPATGCWTSPDGTTVVVTQPGPDVYAYRIVHSNGHVTEGTFCPSKKMYPNAVLHALGWHYSKQPPFPKRAMQHTP